MATYLAALSELASLKEVILGLPRLGGHFSQVESCGGPVEKVKWGKRPEKARFGPGGPEIIGCIASSWYLVDGGVRFGDGNAMSRDPRRGVPSIGLLAPRDGHG